MDNRMAKITAVNKATEDIIRTLMGDSCDELGVMPKIAKIVEDLPQEKVLKACEGLSDEDLDLMVDNSHQMLGALKEGGMDAYLDKAVEISGRGDPEFIQKTSVASLKMIQNCQKDILKACEKLYKDI